MAATPLQIAVNDVVYREDLYPRIKSDPRLVQRYAENLDVLPPIEINQHNILIDGFHRWTAHRKAEAQHIAAVVTETKSEDELFALAIQRNASHGWQMDEESKHQSAIRLFRDGHGLPVDEIRRVLSVDYSTVYRWLKTALDRLKEQRRQRIFDLWLSCHTQEEIADAVKDIRIPGSARQSITDEVSEIRTSADFLHVQGFGKSRDFGFDSEWKPPLYNIWSYGKKSNDVSHFGNSEQRIVENLLYLYTEPFDIVVDPFAGGGSTIDVCRKRLRRYWVSDRKPIVERESEIRTLDLTQELPPLHKRWSEVTLTYLDPPYWRQAANKYSQDATDLANMPLDQFTETLASVVKGIASKQSRGVIALLIQPTQWSADNREYTDHVTDLIRAVGNKRLVLENRVSCPYQSEQYNAQQVEWAKANHKLLVLTRELIIWRLA